MNVRHFLAPVALVALAGCGTTFTPAGPRQPSRPRHCEFDVFTTFPPRDYIEVGSIDAQTWNVRSTSLSSFKNNIEADVCRGGGDAAFVMANGAGEYLKATVLKRIPDPRVAAVPVASTAPIAPPAAPNPALGCQYDTQCKGDRLCVQNACVDPPPAPR